MEPGCLSTVFARLLSGLDYLGVLELQASGTEWMGEGTLAALVALGLFVPAGVRSSFVCPECERLCELEPRARNVNGRTRLEVLCRKVGVMLDVESSQLEVWRLSPEAIGRWLSSRLGLMGVQDLQSEGIFRLGERRIAQERIAFFYIPSIRIAEQTWTGRPPVMPARAVLLTGSLEPSLDRWFPDRAIVSVPHLLDYKAAGLALEPQVVRTALGFTPGPQRHRKLLVTAGTNWKQVIIRMVDDETAHVTIGSMMAMLTPEDFGLTGLRGQEQIIRIEWLLLLEFAEAHGELDRTQAPATSGFRQKLSRLRDAIRTTIGIDADPFVPRSQGGWKCRFTISHWEDVAGIEGLTALPRRDGS